MLRTVPARWFELLVPRESVARSLEVLARTGVVELDTAVEQEELIALPSLEKPLARYAELERRFNKYWPAPTLPKAARDQLLERQLASAMARIEAWCEQAAPHIERIELVSRERGELELLEAMCRAGSGKRKLDFGDLHARTPEMTARVFMLPPESDTPPLADPILYRRLDSGEATWLLVFGREEQVQKLAQALEGHHARSVSVPAMLRGSPEQAMARVQHRLAAAARLLAMHNRALERLRQKHRLAEALGSLHRVSWLVAHLDGIAASEYMARLHGWTSDPEGEAIRTALDKAGIPCALGFPPQPAEREAPSLTVNPPWARPFEIFARLVGTPGRNEADPSMMLAVIAPLLFGYMFGDVGQGAVLLVAGLFMSRRFPATALLIWGGAWAMVFGVLFGSVFGREDLIPALWLHPVVEPLPVLTVPVVVGAILIVLSILLSGLEHQWAGRFSAWVFGEAGMGAALVLGLMSLQNPDLMLAAAGALVLQFFGLAWEFRRSKGMAFARAAADLIEGLMRLVVNTLSFVRVGAFALAHAGLSLAVVSLADGTGNLVISLIVMVIGNALIIAIEGLVASIQTTRLVLFEFFNRFLKAEGREFQPLAPPV